MRQATHSSGRAGTSVQSIPRYRGLTKTRHVQHFLVSHQIDLLESAASGSCLQSCDERRLYLRGKLGDADCRWLAGLGQASAAGGQEVHG